MAGGSADTNGPDSMASAPAPDRRPWGLLASLGWYILIFELEGQAYDRLLNDTGLQAFLDRTYVLHALGIIAAWGINLLIILLAVWLTRIPVRDYLGWVRPRAFDVALGIAVPVALYAAFGLLLFYGGAAAAAVQDYRGAIGAGMSPWWFVLQAWPTLIMSPFVEETFFRGFLWRGVEYRFGNGAAFVVTTILFAAMHYNYWMPGGAFDVASLVQYFISSAILGWLRWKSGGTVVPMIAHALDNAGLKLTQVALSAVIP